MEKISQKKPIKCGEELNPKTTDKAAVYCYEYFNHNAILTKVILKVALGEYSHEECREWFEQNTIKLIS